MALTLVSLILPGFPVNQSGSPSLVGPGYGAASELWDEATERAGVTDSEISFGSCLPLTGVLKERGKQVPIGANCYFNYINEKGGVYKRKIKLTVCDDGYDPTKAIECFNNCLKNKVFAGAFFVGSSPISKYVRMGEVSKIPLIGFCTGTPAAYEFRPAEFVVRPSYTDEVKQQIHDLVSVNHVKRIGVIYQNDAFGAAVRGNALKELQKLGMTPIVEASYTRLTSDVDSAFNQVRAAQPEVVLVGATADALTAIVQKRARQNWNVLFVTYSIATDYLQEVGKDSNGVVVSQVVPPVDNKCTSVELYNKLRAKYYPDEQPNLSAYEGFLNAMVVVEGLKRAGKQLTRTQFINGLESLHNFDIGAGPKFKVSFSPTNHCGLSSSSVYFAVMRDGKPVVMNPGDWGKLIKGAY